MQSVFKNQETFGKTEKVDFFLLYHSECQYPDTKNNEQFLIMQTRREIRTW